MVQVDFQPYRRSVEELLTAPDYYIVPRFQRPYSWDTGNLDEFWRDVLDDSDPGYFIGPMVAWRQGASPKLSIVDGQQRLTTIAILLSVLRDVFRERGRQKLAEGIHRYIEHADRDNEKQFTLQAEVTSSYLNNAILLENPDRTAQPSSDEEAALQRAHKYLQERVADALSTSGQSSETWLRNARDKVLALRVIWVVHGNEDDAYTVFETLNSRGKDLEVVDLLKNHLLNKLRRGGNRSADPYRDRWNSVRADIEESDVRINFNRFLLHWWLSQESYVAQRKLFSAMKSVIQNRDHAAARLASLENDAPLYREVLDPWSLPWGNEERDIPNSLDALSIFGVVQPAPFLLALLRERRRTTEKIGLSHVLRTIRTIVRFHFQFTAISQLSSSGGVSEMYAKYARELTNATDATERVQAVRSLQQALVQRRPDRDRFVTSFVERLVLTDDITREKKLVRYVLQKFLEADRPRTESRALTVEHLLPQDRIGRDPGLTPQTVGSIGNLLMVDENLNTRLNNKDFIQKKSILQEAQSHYEVTDILAATNWDAPSIQARAHQLAADAYDRVWRLPV